MTNPTTPFSWQMPTSTDLVTDLPADFEVFGQAVATSMQDLLGGTTGQVLSKASNTNMDFTWVTTDDANAIQNSIVDAKGDIVAATANDTPARLAVGANYGFLQADSAQATGLLWNNAAWTTYTPTVSAGAGSFTLASATGRYTRVGKLCVVQVSVTITTNGTASVVVFATSPFTAGASSDNNVGAFRETAVTGNTGVIAIGSSGTAFAFSRYDNAYAGGTGYKLEGTISYEVA
jgi:hypothetical protein